MGTVSREYICDNFHNALEKGYLVPFFQPIVRAITGKVYCAEALARWCDPEYGMIIPGDFIPVLEEEGLICELDMEILRRTCEFYKIISEFGTAVPSFSVNLSRYDFMSIDLFEMVNGILDEYGVPHSAIKLEITESLIVEDRATFQTVFKQFTDNGYSIWIDDFGSGYSSLNMLQSFNFDVMKLDMLFLKDFSVKSKQLLAAIINMAKTLGVHTLTEGVETKAHADFLRSVGCDVLQGFYFSEPVSGNDLISMMNNQTLSPETQDDKNYWHEIGRLNFLSANPLEEQSDIEDVDDPGAVLPIALLECHQDKVRHIYASGNYLNCIRALGFDSLADWDLEFNDHRSDQYLVLKKLVTDAVVMGTVNRVEYVHNDVYYRLSAKCLSSNEDRAMLVLRLSIFESEHEEKTAHEMLSYGNALFSTYELAVLIYPKSNIANRIYASQNLPVYDREGSLDMNMRKFCEAEVDSADQKRYMRFLDFSTLVQRIENNPKGFVQDYFRLNWGGSEGTWHTVRVSDVPSFGEKTLILTIQSVQGNGSKILETINKEHSGLLD